MLTTQTDQLYVSWRNPDSTEWHCVGRLQRTMSAPELYYFEYLRGARTEGFRSLAGLEDLEGRYVSDTLFAVFSTRLMSRNRPDYPEYLKWLGLHTTSADAFAELAMSGGIRTSDTLQLFPAPTHRDGRYETVFFVHGLRYQSVDAIAKSQTIHPGELLDVIPEQSNAFDVCAQRICFEGLKLGYVPRYLSCDIATLSAISPLETVLSLEAVNADAPLSYRLLCRFSAPWPNGFQAFSQEEFQPLSSTPA